MGNKIVYFNKIYRWNAIVFSHKRFVHLYFKIKKCKSYNAVPQIWHNRRLMWFYPSSRKEIIT